MKSVDHLAMGTLTYESCVPFVRRGVGGGRLVACAPLSQPPTSDRGREARENTVEICACEDEK